MNINSTNLNFTAKLQRHSHPVYNSSWTKKEMIEDYDSKIRFLQQQKKDAIEFDNFMRSNEVRELVSKLPQEDEVRMFNGYYLPNDAMDVDDSMPFSLIYKEADELADDDEYGYSGSSALLSMKQFSDVQNPDGTLNKEGIKAWLNVLVKFFGNGSKN